MLSERSGTRAAGTQGDVCQPRAERVRHHSNLAEIWPKAADATDTHPPTDPPTRAKLDRFLGSSPRHLPNLPQGRAALANFVQVWTESGQLWTTSDHQFWAAFGRYSINFGHIWPDIDIDTIWTNFGRLPNSTDLGAKVGEQGPGIDRIWAELNRERAAPWSNLDETWSKLHSLMFSMRKPRPTRNLGGPRGVAKIVYLVTAGRVIKTRPLLRTPRDDLSGAISGLPIEQTLPRRAQPEVLQPTNPPKNENDRV